MSDWTWEYEGYDPAAERLRESLCTLGNGYLATRGAVPESRAGLVHYPATYAAGCYNRLESTVAGRRVVNEDLVNLPNWLRLRFRLRSADGPVGSWFSPDAQRLLDYRHTLDLRRATLTRTFRYRDDEAGLLKVEQIRLVHMGDPHLAALRTVFTAEDWSGEIEVESALDGEVINSNVHRYRSLNRRHLAHVQTGAAGPDTVWLSCRTRTSDIGIAMAARTVVTGQPPAASGLHPTRHRAAHRLAIPIAPGRPVIVAKTVALHTSRDLAISDPLGAALDRVTAAPDFSCLLNSHVAAWARLWRRADLQVPGEAGRVLRLHLFHVLQTLSPHTAELDVGVPARGLHGEAYRGHVFWDELFVLPYLNLHFPEVSRALLNYRHRRLPQACRAAGEVGRAGAMYPWQSGSDGREESQELHLNPRSGRWLPDHSRLQHHVGSAVAYNVWQYCQATGDTEYLQTKGAEMLLQIARFWADTAVFDPELGRYRIRGVVGPDEYHDGYPGAARPGLDDNAYTNVTAAWVLSRALDLLRRLPVWRRQELFERVELDGGELPKWDEISRRLRVPFHRGVISQFDGYGDLAELDWDAYRARYDSVRRLDRILEAEGDTVNRYQASKQADALMLGYLFSPAELRDLFDRLGYDLDDEIWRRTVDYYLQRTSHGSTLSGLVHGWVLARVRRAEAWKYCREALEEDVADLQGGTTGEGIHLGAMAGTLDLVQRGLTGLETREDALWLDPVPLPALSEYGFSLRYRGHWGVSVRLQSGQLRIGVPDSEETPIRVVLTDRAVTVAPGETCTLVLPGAGPAGATQQTLRPLRAGRRRGSCSWGPRRHGAPLVPRGAPARHRNSGHGTAGPLPGMRTGCGQFTLALRSARRAGPVPRGLSAGRRGRKEMVMTTAREIMHTGATCVREDETLEDAARRMSELDVGALPICGPDDRLHGIITDRDIVVKCLAKGKDPKTMTAGQLEQGKPITIDAGADTDQVLRAMEEHRIRRLPVIDNRRLVGMISEADLARRLPEERVGHFVEVVCAT